MKTIPLTRGYVALVDDEDYERVAKHRWHSYVHHTGNLVTVYAYRKIRREDGTKTSQSMQHFITGLKHLDHRDNNGINNQRSNLRIATQSQNLANTRKGRGSSPWKGLYFDPRVKRWNVHFKRNGVFHWVGAFKDEVNAAQAYNLAIEEIDGAFAKFNEPLVYSCAERPPVSAEPWKPQYPLLTINGVSKTMTAWAREVGIMTSTLQYRVHAGWPNEKLLAPLVMSKSHKRTKQLAEWQRQLGVEERA